LKIDDQAFPLYANPDTAVRDAFSWAVGLNWHLNRNVKFSVDYEQTKFDGGTSPLLKNQERTIFTRAQVSF